MHFLARVCLRDSHGLSPVFPDRNHKKPDFKPHKRRSALKRPPLVDDDYPANSLRDDCIMLTSDMVRHVIETTSIDPPKEDEHLMFDIQSLIKKLHPMIASAKEKKDMAQYAFLRHLLRVAAEGRFVGGTHLVMTPIMARDLNDA